MVARSHAIFRNAPVAMQVVAVIGCVPRYSPRRLAGPDGHQKSLAYSTVSQLGYMFWRAAWELSAPGVSPDDACVLQGIAVPCGGQRDSRNGRRTGYAQNGGLRKKIPWTFWTMSMATLAIAGTPGFSGFFSKDEILLATQRASAPLWALGVFNRRPHLVLYVSPAVPDVLRRQRFDEKHVHVHESPRNMLAPLVVLAILAVGGGWMAAPHLWGGANFFAEYLAPVFSTAPETPAAARSFRERDRIAAGAPGAPVIAGLIGFFFAWWFYIRSPKTRRSLPPRSLRPTNCSAENTSWTNCTRHHCPAPRLDFRQGSVARCG